MSSSISCHFLGASADLTGPFGALKYRPQFIIPHHFFVTITTNWDINPWFNGNNHVGF
jgi:hypothetical protein